MSVLRLAPVACAFWLLTAHFFRHGFLFSAGFYLLFPALLLVRRAWAWWALRIGLWYAALVWALVAFELIMTRVQAAERWGVAALILGGVVAFTLVSERVLRGAHERFAQSSEGG